MNRIVRSANRHVHPAPLGRKYWMTWDSDLGAANTVDLLHLTLLKQCLLSCGNKNLFGMHLQLDPCV